MNLQYACLCFPINMTTVVKADIAAPSAAEWNWSVFADRFI